MCFFSDFLGKVYARAEVKHTIYFERPKYTYTSLNFDLITIVLVVPFLDTLYTHFPCFFFNAKTVWGYCTCPVIFLINLPAYNSKCFVVVEAFRLREDFTLMSWAGSQPRSGTGTPSQVCTEVSLILTQELCPESEQGVSLILTGTRSRASYRKSASF